MAFTRYRLLSPGLRVALVLGSVALSILLLCCGGTAVIAILVDPVRPASHVDNGSKQYAYQATVQNERRDLFKGELHVVTDRRVKVTDWFDVRVLICGPANTDDLCVSPSGTGGTPSNPEINDADVRLGGRVGVTLATADSAVEIKNLVTAQDNTQPLTDPTDAGLWVWDVRAKEPGEYTLRASVFVLSAETNQELVPRETVSINLKVERTGGFTAKQVGRSILDVTNWSAPHIVTIVTALVAAGGVTTLVRRRKRRQRAGAKR
ncbi:hypothetical protein OG992_33270 [Micromonospora sp. NBC_00362]|uniref:hypothetical protein n=1 Tax=Micromonospora sp. NBC_00362 TaxID=2975975 RepID=UPI002250A4A0|nr:hypothetical protein [Micromonospora sp. NBC_00362]MCX5122036.1 hypothetical protein [Micromonospora sp. NBC_00362]